MAYIPRKRRRSPWVREKVAFEGVVQDPRYWTTTWKRAREVHMRAHPTCQACGQLGTLVDHIVAVRDGGEFYDVDNWQTLCMTCHGKKTARETRARGGRGSAK